MADDLDQERDEREPLPRRRSRRRSRRASDTRPYVETRAAQAPPRRSGTVPSVKTLTLRNRSGQVLFVPVVNDDGSSRNVRLGAGQSITVAEDRLTDYTQRMADKGQLTIRPLR